MATEIDRILVTGSEGFIGSHLMKALGHKGEGYDILNSSAQNIRDRSELYWIMKYSKLKAVVHLAAVSSLQQVEQNPDEALETNIRGTFNVLNEAKKFGLPVIVASSAAALEPSSSLYGYTKSAAENLCYQFDNAYIARFYNVYGPRSKSVVNRFITQIQNGQPIILNGNTVRDYVYVTDIVRDLMCLLSNPNQKVSEFGTSIPTTLVGLVEKIEQALSKKAKVKQGPPVAEIQESYLLERMAGKKYTFLERGIRKTINGRT